MEQRCDTLQNYPDSDTIRILITTDNHVGYNEFEPITGDDSWKTFHEIMMLAKAKNVDMILQSGDLFHVNKPSKKSMYQVMRSLRLACMGDKPCELELLSDAAKVFNYNEFNGVNYEDSNFNIAIPMFSIAGNHDDASGHGFLTPMDVLQVSGLLNHFGRVKQADDIELNPLLFQKGKTKLALYGLGSIRDERLFRSFKEGHVRFNIPLESQDDWFNIMCVHQNHSSHSNTAFLPEAVLPDFLNLVIWGHEHECIPYLVHNSNKGFDVLQPGSSVATSLSDGESKDKFVFIVEIKSNSPPDLIPFPLTTVRSLIVEDVSLADVPGLKPHDKENICKYLVEKVNELIQKANERAAEKLGITLEGNEDSLPLPLIRLRVNYNGPNGSAIDYQVENPRRFSNRFVGRVANANNVIQFSKKRHPGNAASKKDALKHDLNNNYSGLNGDLKVQTLIKDFLVGMNLSLLPENGMNEAVRNFVDKDDKNALKEFIEKEVTNEVALLASNKNIIGIESVTDLKNLVHKVKQSTQCLTNSNSPYNDIFEHGKKDELRFSKSHLDSDHDLIVVEDPKHSEEQDTKINLILSDDDGSDIIAEIPNPLEPRKKKKRATKLISKTPIPANKEDPVKITKRSSTRTPKTTALHALLNIKRGFKKEN